MGETRFWAAPWKLNNFLLLLSTVKCQYITRSNITSYCTHHCRNWGRISIWTHKRHPIARPSFCEYFEEIWPRYNGTALYSSVWYMDTVTYVYRRATWIPWSDSQATNSLKGLFRPALPDVMKLIANFSAELALVTLTIYLSVHDDNLPSDLDVALNLFQET